MPLLVLLYCVFSDEMLQNPHFEAFLQKIYGRSIKPSAEENRKYGKTWAAEPRIWTSLGSSHS